MSKKGRRINHSGGYTDVPLRENSGPNYAVADAAEDFAGKVSVCHRLEHSRALSEVIRKEGEAAILWFRQVLAK